MPDPPFRKQESSQVWMPFELYPEEIPYLSFAPVCRSPDRNDGRHLLSIVDLDLKPEAVPVFKRRQVVDDVETRSTIEPVRRRDVRQVVVLELVAAIPGNFDYELPLNQGGHFAAKMHHVEHRIAEARSERFRGLFGAHATLRAR
jgi:hypothetical protein